MTKRLLLAIGLLLPALLKADATEPQVRGVAGTITFGVVPQQSSRRLIGHWGPVLRYLEDTTGLRVQFQTAPTIPAFEERLRHGEYDFAYMNPYHYTVFHEQPGYQAIAHARDKRIKGVIVVSRDSPVTTVQQLSGGDMAFPAPAAFAATLLTRALLDEQGVAIRPRFVGSHDAVYRAVAAGVFAAGGGIPRTLESVPADIRSRLRVLVSTQSFTPHAIAVHPRVEASVVERVRRALVRLGDDPRGRDPVSGLRIAGFTAAQDGDWDDVRALGLTAPVGVDP